MQLHALLESIVEYAPDLYRSIVVLYRPTSPMHALGYLECGRAFKAPTIEFWRESESFEADVREWVGGADEQICFLVDDDLFIRPAPATVYLYEPTICYSLRLGAGTGPGWDEWNWQHAAGDYGYPFALDGHIYFRADVEQLLRGLRFDDPTRLEAGGAGRVAEEWAHRPRMAAADERCLIGIPANRVSSSSGMPFDNRGRGAWSPEALTVDYLDGIRIDRAAMQAELLAATDAHWPATLRFTQE